MSDTELKIGGKYNFKHAAERLVYLGHNWSGNGYWYQFALVSEPNKVWCELLVYDLALLEETTTGTQDNGLDHEPRKAGTTYTVIGTQHGGAVTRHIQAISPFDAGVKATHDDIKVLAVFIGQHSNEWKVVA